MKKGLTLMLICVSLFCTVFTVAAKGDSEKASSVGTGELSGTVTMWAFPLSGDDAAMYEPIVKSFNEKYPNVKIDIQILPWNGRYEKMLTAIAGGNPPNVVYLNDFQVPLFASTNNLVNMNEVFTPEELSAYKDGALKAVSYDGTLYGIPILTNSLGYLYNVDLFKEAGLDPDNPPKTWAELEDAIARLTKRDANGEIVQWGARFDLNRPSPVTSILPLIWQAGGDILDADGNVIIDSPETRQALEFIRGLFEKGYIQKSNMTGGGLMFSSGKIGVDLQKEPSDVKKVSQENPSLNFKVGPILTGNQKVGYVTCGTYSIFSKAKNRDAAVAWVKHLTSQENTEHILAASGFMSPRKDVSEADYMTDERLIFMASQGEWATGTGPMNSHYSEILAATGSSLNSIILGIKDADTGLKELTNQINSIMGK